MTPWLATDARIYEEARLNWGSLSTRYVLPSIVDNNSSHVAGMVFVLREPALVLPFTDTWNCYRLISKMRRSPEDHLSVRGEFAICAARIEAWANSAANPHFCGCPELREASLDFFTAKVDHLRRLAADGNMNRIEMFGCEAARELRARALLADDHASRLNRMNQFLGLGPLHRGERGNFTIPASIRKERERARARQKPFLSRSSMKLVEEVEKLLFSGCVTAGHRESQSFVAIKAS